MSKIERYAGDPADIITVLSGADLTSLANNANGVGAAIDPGLILMNSNPSGSTGAFWELLFTPAASISAGVAVSLYFIPTIDGTNYANGSSSVVPAAVHLADQFICASGTGQQRLILPMVYFPPFKFKPVLVNTSGQAFSSASTHTLKYCPFRRYYRGA